MCARHPRCVPGWTSCYCPETLPELADFLARWAAEVSRIEPADPLLKRTLEAGDLRRDREAIEAGKLDVANRIIADVHRWLDHAGITGAPDWPATITDLPEAGRQLSLLLNFVRKHVAPSERAVESRADPPAPGGAEVALAGKPVASAAEAEIAFPAPPPSLVELSGWIRRARELLRGEEERSISDSGIGRTVRKQFLEHLERLSCPGWPEVHQKAFKLSVVGELAGMMASVGDALEFSKTQPASQPEKRPIGFVTDGGPGFLFVPDGTSYEIRGFGERAHLEYLTGLGYIEKLLRQPGKAIGFSELVGDVTPERATEAAEQTANETLDLEKWSNQPALDEQALREYKERLQEIETELEDTRQCNDSSRQERLEREKGEVLATVQAAIGLGNSARDLNSDADKLRSRIHSALKKAYKKLEENKAPRLAQHFKESISSEKGAFKYAPKLSTPDWSFDMLERR